MATLAGDLNFDFTWSTHPSTPPEFSFDPSLFEMPVQPIHSHNHSNGYSRTSSTASTIYSLDSAPASLATASIGRTTPSRSPVVRTHGPLLLPKIRMQDQNVVPIMASVPCLQSTTRTTKRMSTSPALSTLKSTHRPGHSRSMTMPEHTSYQPNPVSYSLPISQESSPTSLLGASVIFPKQSFPVQLPSATMDNRSQRASSCTLDDDVTVEKFGCTTYGQMPLFVVPHPVNMAASPEQEPTAPDKTHVSSQPNMTSLAAPSAYYTPYLQQSQQPPQTYTAPHPASPTLKPALTLTPTLTPTPTPEPQPTQPAQIIHETPLAVCPPTSQTTLLHYLCTANPAPSLVRTISFPLRGPHTKHFWWDVRQIRPWTSFNTNTLMSLADGSAASLLTCPVPSTFLPNSISSQRHPEDERALHSIYANYYLPKLNAALALSSNLPLQLAVPPKTGPHSTRDNEQMFVANVSGDASSAAAIFGGKPSARVVGLVKSFDRFNTGMRVEGNVKRVEYLRGLAHLHHAMREHGCRFGFVLTEIELVVVRNGLEDTPHYGFLEVASCHLATTTTADDDVTMTACLALWGLCMLATDELLPHGHTGFRAEIGAPAEGTRRKALPRDSWMPPPQLAEKREAKRSRGWVWPEDPVSRKELGKRGVRYGAC